MLEAGESLKRSTEQSAADKTSLQAELESARTQLGATSASLTALQQEHEATFAQLQASQEAAKKLENQVAKATVEKAEAESRCQSTREEYELVWVDLKLSQDQLGEARREGNKAHRVVEEKEGIIAEL